MHQHRPERVLQSLQILLAIDSFRSDQYATIGTLKARKQLKNKGENVLDTNAGCPTKLDQVTKSRAAYKVCTGKRDSAPCVVRVLMQDLVIDFSSETVRKPFKENELRAIKQEKTPLRTKKTMKTGRRSSLLTRPRLIRSGPTG
ncbi:hypothetical protein K470DRAFT_55650 [Piedraia hortae CBS 480.64]|uniref:Uncharacterized protein n=1 Tax=Piedraia hortae CBS 480.64 TaxID=1314780 RepID=A0A6A7CA17_9PEZI|nr:hypothetical protein K470DRAFT_55650 [Piedraia hortae CBS 480.64]